MKVAPFFFHDLGEAAPPEGTESKVASMGCPDPRQRCGDQSPAAVVFAKFQGIVKRGVCNLDQCGKIRSGITPCSAPFLGACGCDDPVDFRASCEDAFGAAPDCHPDFRIGKFLFCRNDDRRDQQVVTNVTELGEKNAHELKMRCIRTASAAPPVLGLLAVNRDDRDRNRCLLQNGCHDAAAEEVV